MKKHFKIIITIAAALILVSAWRLWPHTFSSVISADAAAVDSIACAATVCGLDSDGRSFMDNYELPSLTDGDEEFSAILDILMTSEYRQGFGNLFPWALTSVGSDSGRTAQIFLAWGNNENDTCYLVFHEDGQIAVSPGADNGFKVYHAVDGSTFGRLADYVQEHGAKK